MKLVISQFESEMKTPFGSFCRIHVMSLIIAFIGGEHNVKYMCIALRIDISLLTSSWFCVVMITRQNLSFQFHTLCWCEIFFRIFSWSLLCPPFVWNTQLQRHLRLAETATGEKRNTNRKVGPREKAVCFSFQLG